MSNLPGHSPPYDGFMRHQEFHPWASKIGELQQAASSTQEQLRDLKRAVEDLPVKLRGEMLTLRGEMLAALAEADKRQTAQALTQSQQIERLSADAARREQRQHIMFGIGILLMFIATFSARPDTDQLTEKLGSAVTVGAKIAEKM